MLPYFYHPENFTTKITLPSFSEPLQNKIDYLDLFKKIAPKDDDLNKLREIKDGSGFDILQMSKDYEESFGNKDKE